MKKGEIFILSDLHINLLPDEKRSSLFEFFNSTVSRRAQMLLLNGDIIDLMAKSSAHTTMEVLSQFDQMIRNLTRKGVEIHYNLGNHDLPLLLLFPTFPKSINGFVDVHKQQQPISVKDGLTLHYRYMEFEAGNRKAYMEHGHIYDLGWVPGETWMRAWEKACRMDFRNDWLENVKSIWNVFQGNGEDSEARILRTGFYLPAPLYASREANRISTKLGKQVVILSHFHSPCLEEMGKDRLYVNPGDSLQHSNYVVVSDDGIRLGDWQEMQNKLEKSVE